MSFKDIYRNRIRSPLIKPRISPSGGERDIIWAAGDSGLLQRIEDLERRSRELESRVGAIDRSEYGRDFVPGPVDAYPFSEISSDGALRAGVSVRVPAGGLYELALFPEPEVFDVVADAHVREAAPNSNFGTRFYLVVGGTGGDESSYLALEEGPASPHGLWSMPTIALLRLQVWVSLLPSNLLLRCRLVTGDWSESTITWNNQPAVEDQVLAEHQMLDGDEDAWLDLRPLLHRMRRKADEGDPLSVKGFRIDGQAGAATYNAAFYSRENPEEVRPRLYCWHAPDTSKMAQGGTDGNRLYAKPGGIYWFAYRLIDANNNPSEWSMPLRVQLPSEGPVPAKPSKPAVENTNFSNVKRIILSTSTPLDFAYYDVELRYSTGGGNFATQSLRTTANRTEVTLESGGYASARLYEARYRLVTRSGMEGTWSDWADVGTIFPDLIIQRADKADSTQISIDDNGEIHFYHASGTSARTWDYVEGQASLLLQASPGEVSSNLLRADNRYAHALATGSWSTNQTSYQYLALRNFTPPGTGTAHVLFVATLGVDGAAARYELRADAPSGNTVLVTEYGYNQAIGYQTITLFGVATVPRGAQTQFCVRWRSEAGSTIRCYQHNLLTLDLGG